MPESDTLRAIIETNRELQAIWRGGDRSYMPVEQAERASRVAELERRAYELWETRRREMWSWQAAGVRR